MVRKIKEITAAEIALEFVEFVEISSGLYKKYRCCR